MDNKPHIKINTYHEYMGDACTALSSSLRILKEAESIKDDTAYRESLYLRSGELGRYAFLLAVNSLEAAANALILSLNTSQALYKDFEKLSTLLKFELFCFYCGEKLNRGNDLYSKIREVVKCRNKFVHPKPKKVTGKLTSNGSDVEIDIKRTNSRNFPVYFSLFEPKHTIQAVGDIMKFLSWIVFDICKYSIKEGSMILGYGSISGNEDVFILANKYGFDIRTFGNNQDFTIVTVSI